MPDRDTIAIADRDDLIFIDAATANDGARVAQDRARFVWTLNERGDIVIGGQSEIAAFDPVSGRELWRARHTPPGAASSHCRGDRGACGFALFPLRWSGNDAHSVELRRASFKLAGARDASNRRSVRRRVQAFGIARVCRSDRSSQLDRLSRFLWHRERLATLRGSGCISTQISSGGMVWRGEYQ
jgi:hypothetical protein